MMTGFSNLRKAFHTLDLRDKAVIAHASLKKFGLITDGPRTVLQALMATCRSLIMPTFTYKTMITPQDGPPDNGLTYGSETNLNKMAEFFRHSMPADKMMGILPAVLLAEPTALRTSHPILSFGGIRAEDILLTQTINDPLAPIRALAGQDGWVVLINVDHTVNTSIHYGEKLAGRRQFIRWALTPRRIVECPGYPGDSSGFNAIEEPMRPHTRRVDLDGGAFVQAVPLKQLLEVTVELIKKDPLALLCQREDCGMCNSVRNM